MVTFFWKVEDLDSISYTSCREKAWMGSLYDGGPRRGNFHPSWTILSGVNKRNKLTEIRVMQLHWGILGVRRYHDKWPI